MIRPQLGGGVSGRSLAPLSSNLLIIIITVKYSWSHEQQYYINFMFLKVI